MTLLHLRLVVNRAVVISLIVSTKWHWLLFAPETKPPGSHTHPLYTGTSCIIYAHNEALFNIFYILIQLVFPPWFPSLNLHSDSFLIGSGKLRTLCLWGLSSFPRLLKKWEEGLLSSVCTRDCGDPCWSVTPPRWLSSGNFLSGAQKQRTDMTRWRPINVLFKMRHSKTLTATKTTAVGHVKLSARATISQYRSKARNNLKVSPWNEVACRWKFTSKLLLAPAPFLFSFALRELPPWTQKSTN